MTALIATLPVQLCCVVIDKIKLQKNYKTPKNPYHLGLQLGLERVLWLLEQNHASDSSHVIVERRGKNEDDDLELEFRRICDGANFAASKMPLEVIFSDKKTNSTGLQLADLMARPVGMSVLKPQQANRAMDVIRTKLLKAKGKTEGWGLKCFPE